MTAELIAIGTELLRWGRGDGNGDWLASRIEEMGLAVSRRTTVEDDEGVIADAFGAARGRARLVVATGGLGPTRDDLTREGLAVCLGVPLVTDAGIREGILKAYRTRGFAAEGPADRQSRIPAGCEAVANPVGSAPGILHPGPPCWTLVLPGVPREMRAMFDAVAPRLATALGGRPSPRARLLVAGMVESEVDEALRDLIGPGPLGTVTILAGVGGIEILAAGAGGDASDGEVARIVAEARRRLGPAVVGTGDVTVASAVGDLLRARRGRLAVAESCTGGLVGGRVTEIPGSSEWFVGGFVVYSDAMKESVLGVPADLLAAHGAVSEPVAVAMAKGALARAGATHAVSITGIAGPGGGTPAKPVGLVHFAVASAHGVAPVRRLFGGDRQTIRGRAVTAALDLARRRLLEEGA